MTSFETLSHLLWTPRPCRGGAGVGSVFFPHNFFDLFIFFSLLLDITDPTQAPKPHPYPLSKVRGGLWGVVPKILEVRGAIGKKLE